MNKKIAVDIDNILWDFSPVFGNASGRSTPKSFRPLYGTDGISGIHM
jgi:hypothetical protein